MQTHINDNSKPLIFLGSNAALHQLTNICEEYDIKVLGIIDKDYYGNTDNYCDIPVIDSEENIDKYSNYNFFVATNWLPLKDDISIRNKQKSNRLIELVKTKNLSCISLVSSKAAIARTAIIGKNVLIDGLTLLESKVKVGDFTSIHGQCLIGHDTEIMENCVFQRCAGAVAYQVYENDVYVGLCVQSTKSRARFGKGTFIHELVHIARGTIPYEEVSFNGGNTKRIKKIYR
jgi:hypothetical protein